MSNFKEYLDQVLNESKESIQAMKKLGLFGGQRGIYKDKSGQKYTWDPNSKQFKNIVNKLDKEDKINNKKSSNTEKWGILARRTGFSMLGATAPVWLKDLDGKIKLYDSKEKADVDAQKYNEHGGYRINYFVELYTEK